MTPVTRFYSAVVVLLLTAGCIRATPETPPPAEAPTVAEAPPPVKEPEATPPPTKAPDPAAKKPGTGVPAPKAQKPAAKVPSPPRQKTPAPKAQAPKATAPVTPAAPPRQTAPALDLAALTAQLKATKAIGVFTKLTLKNQVDDLLDEFRDHHAGKAKPSVTELRRSYDLLMMKVLSLLQDRDQKLASQILSSRERIWGVLADPKEFAALQV
jgi:hypothetical protein